MNNEPHDEEPVISSPTNEEDFDEPPHKIGDVIEQNGVRRVVTGLRRSIGGLLWAIDTSAEPLAKEQGYITLDQSLGFKVEHYPPPFVGRGACRDASKLSAGDWDFRELLNCPDTEKRAALFHELARESSRMREACRIYEEGRANNVAAKSCFDDGRQGFRDAEKFLGDRIKSFPYGVRGLLTKWIAKDLPWMQAPDSERKDLLNQLEALEQQREGKKKQALGFSDLPGNGPDWPFDSPIQFATDPKERGQLGQPSYQYNDGFTGRPVLTFRGNGVDAPRILSESLELCVCLNFRDEEILDAFQKWLDWRRESLPETLAEFKFSSKRPAVK